MTQIDEFHLNCHHYDDRIYTPQDGFQLFQAFGSVLALGVDSERRNAEKETRHGRFGSTNPQFVILLYPKVRYKHESKLVSVKLQNSASCRTYALVIARYLSWPAEIERKINLLALRAM